MELKIKAELLFVLITLVLVVLIMWPIWQSYQGHYTYYGYNVAFIAIFLTLTRYLFLLRYAPFSHNKIIKASLIFICIPIFLYMIDGLYEFQRFLDEKGLNTLPSASKDPLAIARYTRYQYIFFAAGGLITLALIPFRMVISLWRQYNKNTI